jgi:RimJ/RimL family protein N-acetyltransferase
MTRPVCIHDRSTLAAYFRRRPALHLYEFGDLGPFFWPHTTWYAFATGADIEECVLVYSGSDLPVLIAMAEAPLDRMRDLLAAIRSRLPARLYAHLTPGLIDLLEPDYKVEPRGAHLRMRLSRPEVVQRFDRGGTTPLGRADREDLEAFYRTAYPGNWFDPRMLDTGVYHGIRQNGRLVGVAGVHVHSPEYRVAALGNIATHPDLRGRGIGTAVTAAVCRQLLDQVDLIGLNVHEENATAIRCYERLGFERCASYQECMLEWIR